MKKDILSIVLCTTICIAGFPQVGKSNAPLEETTAITSFNASVISHIFSETPPAVRDNYELVQQSQENSEKVLQRTRIRRTMLTSGLLLFTAGAITALSGFLFFSIDSLADNSTDTYFKKDAYLIGSAGMMIVGAGLSGASQLFWGNFNIPTSQTNDALDEELREYQEENIDTNF